MPTVKLTIPVAPTPQGRPKFARIGNHVTTYDPPASKQYKALVTQYARHQWLALPLDGAIRLKVTFYRELQKNLSQAERQARMSGRKRPVVKPDIDNYYKAVSDALTGIVWVDDNQIVDMHVSKWYSDTPRVEIEVEEL